MGSQATSFVLLGAALLAIFSLVWLWRELFPRRRGQTPHCQRCRYNLSGASLADADARCPECGALLGRRNAVVQGERRYSPSRMGAAAILLAITVPICFGLLYARLTNLDWRRAAPSWVLLRMARSAAPLDTQMLLGELVRRYEADSLNGDERYELADVCLAVHAAPKPPLAALGIAADLLGRQLVASQLSPAQQQQFVDGALVMQTSVRKPLVTGMNAAVRISYARRLPPNLTMTVQLCNRTLDGRPCAMLPAPSSFSASGCGADGRFEQVLICPAEGAHEFAVDADIELADTGNTAGWPASAPAANRNAPVVIRTRKTLKARVDVAAGDPSEHVRPIETPAAQEAADAVNVAAVLHRPSHSTVEATIALLDTSAIWMIFDCRMEVEDRVVELGWVSLEPNADLRVWTLRANYEGELPSTVTVALRTSAARARQHALAAEFFGGARRFENVPVLREQASGGYFHPIVGWVSLEQPEPDCPE